MVSHIGRQALVLSNSCDLNVHHGADDSCYEATRRTNQTTNISYSKIFFNFGTNSITYHTSLMYKVEKDSAGGGTILALLADLHDSTTQTRVQCTWHYMRLCPLTTRYQHYWHRPCGAAPLHTTHYRVQSTVQAPVAGGDATGGASSGRPGEI